MPSDQGSKASFGSVEAATSPPSVPPAPDPTATPASGFRFEQAAGASPDEKTIISKSPPTADTPPPLVLTPQHLGQTLIGKRLDHYELVEFVGGGGMGAVFRATDTRLGRNVAVKVLSRDQTDDDTIRRFRNEAQSAARLDHPNIARVHFVGEDAGWNYIVFEFIDGVNLRDLVERDGPLSLEDALNYTLQVAEALAHAAGRDVVHRDIKPSNVLVTPSGAVKLVDMGLARLHQVESSSDDLTASGVTLGTFDYISPEQARDPRSADVRSDIYSLGCTLYFMLVGRPPFPDGTALQKLLRHNGDDPPDPRLYRPELNPKVSALLARMLAKRPSQRQQNPDVLIQEIVGLADQLGLEFARRKTASRTAPAAAPTLWSRAAPVAVPVLVLGVVLIVLDALLPASTSTADLSLRPKFAKPAISSAKPALSPADSAAADLLSRPIVNPDRSLRRDGPPSTGSAEPTGITVGSGTSSPAPMPPISTMPPLPASSNSAATDDEPPDSPAAKTPDRAVTDTPGSIMPPVGDQATDRSPAPKTAARTAPSTTSTTDDTEPAITKLVVQPRTEATAVDGIETVGSLAAACRRAAELGVTDIELHFDGDLIEKPFEIASSRLTIRPGAGFRPRIVFQPDLAMSAEQRQMIRLTGATTTRLTISGLSLRLKLPAEPSFGWALFALQPSQSVEVVDSVLTVEDSGSLGGPVHEQVAMFYVAPRRVTDTMTRDDESAMAPQLTIGLTRTIARGEATLVSMPDESPLKLAWNQGLLAVSGRLLETGGTILKPKWFGRIEIDLDHVTVVAQQGLHQMRRRGGAAHQLDVDVRSNRSILYTSPEAAVFEFANVPAVEDVKLTFDGADNRYPRPDVVFVRVKLAEPGAETQDFDLENRSRWSTERRPDLGVVWKSPAPAGSPLHDHTKADYVQEEGAMNDAGFDPTLLPDAFPAAPQLPPPPAADAPATDDDPPPAPPMDSPSPTGMRIPSDAAEPMSRAVRGSLR